MKPIIEQCKKARTKYLETETIEDRAEFLRLLELVETAGLGNAFYE